MVVIAFISTALLTFIVGFILGILGTSLFEVDNSKVKEKEKSICLDFLYAREKENDTVQEVRLYYKDNNNIFGCDNPVVYFTYRSGFGNKEALRRYVDQACENRGWKFEFTDYEVDYTTGLPIEKVEKEIK